MALIIAYIQGVYKNYNLVCKMKIFEKKGSFVFYAYSREKVDYYGDEIKELQKMSSSFWGTPGSIIIQCGY